VRVAAAQKQPPFRAVAPGKAYYDTQHVKATEGFELLDLPDNGCSFPTGENEHRHLFCGLERHGTRSYCAAHSRISYRPLWGRSVA
jgi:hypothetical protein